VTIAPPAIEAKPHWSGEGDGSYNKEIQHRSNKCNVPTRASSHQMTITIWETNYTH
jgi:hypothetical protein